MEISEEHLAFAEHRALHGLRLLHLDDHVGCAEDLARRGGHLRACAYVVVVHHADSLPRIALDDDLVPLMHDLADRLRGQADAIFENLDFLGDADAHGFLPG